MACRYYDDLIVEKLKRWLPETTNLRVLKPDETKRFFELTADDNKDEPFSLPLLAVSRSTEVELLSTVKSPKSYEGLRLIPNNIKTDLSDLKGDDYKKARAAIPTGVYTFNVIPIKLNYQLDIYTKTAEECDEYLRNFLFKLINNPVIKVLIPYNNFNIEHIANIRVLNQISDTSSISERLFSGQFTRWTIQIKIQDAFLFSIPYKKNWCMIADPDVVSTEIEIKSSLEVVESDNLSSEIEELPLITLKKEIDT